MNRSLLLCVCAVSCLAACPLYANEVITIWPDFAPGETTRSRGELQPFRPQEQPPVSRVVKITEPTLDVFPAQKPNGTAVIILPGGGFAKVVPDKEGSELAVVLNKLGVTAFVLRYRTKNSPSDPGWKKPLQDAQRSLSLVRARASQYKVETNRIGLIGFSAGGQVAARLLANDWQRQYKPLDNADEIDFRPNFAALIYPWNIYDSKNNGLLADIKISKDCPPTFLAHTDDDRSSSLGAVLFYADLKQLNISSELHVYGNGGHGYGLRPVAGSQISTWAEHCTHWIGQQGFLK